MASSLPWHGWIGSQIEQLRAQDLLRTLKPLIPGHSATEVRVQTVQKVGKSTCCWHWDVSATYYPSPQVIVAPDVLQAWTEECDPQSCEGLPTEGSLLRLFSSNDYMGLSCHPSVCRAAADAVLRHGMGKICPTALQSIRSQPILSTR